jgi:hypothetical protein
MQLRIMIAMAAVFLAASMSGCAISPQATQYYADEELRNEARSLNYQMTYNQNANRFLFNEGVVDIAVQVFFDQDYHFSLDIKNNTSRRVIIDWNRVEYLDATGNPHSMIHQGVNYLDPVTKQRPTYIPPGAIMRDLLRPADRRTMDGAVRLVKPAHTPAADDYYDHVAIILPLKAEGQWVRYRLLIQVGMVAPTTFEGPYGPYY